MKFRKKIIAIVLMVLLVLSNAIVCSASCFEPYIKQQEKIVTKAYVKAKTSIIVSERASINSKAINTISPGDIVIVINQLDNNWSIVELEDGSKGYVLSDYIVIPEQDTSQYELISVAVITSKNSSSNRNFNMAKACEAINQIILLPGYEFNWYGKKGEEGIVGNASKENGYKLATIIEGGKYVKGYGGGVCQVSTALYNCIYKLGIEPTERHSHSIQSSYVPKGMDATVSYPSKNFVFTNTLDYSIMFEAYTDEGQVIVLAYEVY